MVLCEVIPCGLPSAPIRKSGEYRITLTCGANPETDR
jgi:hypothetical protein